MKKILSIVLCIAMLAGMLPAVFAAETETTPDIGTVVEYDLTTNAFIDYSGDTTNYKKTVQIKQDYFSSLENATKYLDSQNTAIWYRVGENIRRTAVYSKPNYYDVQFIQNEDARFALMIDVPYAGNYTVSVTPYKYTVNTSNPYYVGCASNVYIFSSDEESLTVSKFDSSKYEKIVTVKHFTDEAATSANVVQFDSAGKYYVVFDIDLNNADFQKFLTDRERTVNTDHDDSTHTDGCRLYARVSSITLTYTGAIGGEGDGDGGDSSGDSGEAELEDVEAEFDYKEESHTGGASSIRAFAVYGTDSETSEEQIIEAPTVTYGESCTVTAPEAPEGYKFLYWAKGATMQKKQIVSYDAELSDYLPREGVNYLLAVYEREDASATDKQEFYNANGQLLADVEITNGLMPSYPSMAGYGKAKAWALRNEDGSYTKYYANEAAPETEGTGTLIFMAVYDDLKADITVTINGTAKKYKYGDEVICTASAPSGESFMYWTKNDEVISLAPEYKFNAWEDCEVEAVYGAGVDALSRTMRKIILDRFVAGDSDAIMAEFIGFDDALEKGIMFGNQKVSMSSDKSQFTVLDDATSEGIATGYAIVREGNTLKKITDGEATIGKENEEILAERRNIAESYMRESVSLLWTPSEDIDYHVGPADGGFDAKLVAGRIYRGLPYVYNAGTPDSFLNYAGTQNANGVYTISNLSSALLSGGQGVARIGNDCSGALIRAWTAMGASIQAKATRYMVPANGFIKVGDYTLPEGLSDYAASSEVNTKTIATANGEQTMYEAYARLQKADAVVEYNGESGHSRMVVTVSVERNADGTINGSSSKIRMLEQTRTEFKNQKTYKALYGTDYGNGIEGDVYVIGGDYNFKFSDLYAEGFLPITCRELVDASYIKEATVTDSVSNHSIDNLFTGTISSNWAIDTVTLNITGDGVSQSAAASIARADIFNFSMKQFEEDKSAGMLYGSYDIESLASGTYNCTVTVTLVEGTEFTVRDFDFTK